MPSKTLDRNCISAWKKATPLRVQPTNLAISCFNIEKCQDKDLFIYNTKWKLSTNKPKMHGITNEKMRQTWVLLSLRLLGCWEECISNGQIIRNIITSYCIKYLLNRKREVFYGCILSHKQESVALDSQANKTLDNERIHKHMSLFLHEIIIIAYKKAI